MSKQLTKTKLTIPTLQELITETEISKKENALMVLLNQEPPQQWIKKHPIVNSEYLPINRVEYLLSRIFGKWWVEVRSTQLMANSVAVTVRLFVINPVTLTEEWQDGCAAAPIQTDSGAGATDWNKVKSAGVQMALPIAESFAIKDAAEKFGKIFGKDLNRKELISYDSLLKVAQPVKEVERISLMIQSAETLTELNNLREYVTDENTDLFADKFLTLNQIAQNGRN